MGTAHELIKPIFKYMRVQPVRIYDSVFLLHSKCTVVLLLIFSALLSVKQYFGDPIQCLSYEKAEYVNSYCWTMSTYIISNIKTRDEIAEGVGAENSQPTRHYLRYYQWVVLLLLIQSLVFYMTSFLWKIWEGQRLQQLCTEITEAVVPDEIYTKRRRLLLQYFCHNQRRIHLGYMVKYIVCELLNVIVSVLNIVALELFFNGFWLEYYKAFEVLIDNDWESWNSVTSKIFPKVSKCDLAKFGASGSKNKIDALCMLPLNVFNEKIFLFLWCWFLMMALLVAMKFLSRLLLISCKTVRVELFRVQLHNFSRKQTRFLLDNISIGDWFMLVRVGSNINPILFRELIKELCDHYESRRNVELIL